MGLSVGCMTNPLLTRRSLVAIFGKKNRRQACYNVYHLGAMTERALPPLPARMANLRRDARGYPVPWFVHWEGEEPDFRVIGAGKIREAHLFERCWVCGERRGRFMAFVLGPMCAVNRTSSEPPCHRDCAIFSAKACPFLTRPKMRRNKKGVEGKLESNSAGVAIDRNPGVALVWETRSYDLFVPPPPHNKGGGVLFQIGEPIAVHWFAEGREATRAEVMHSIETGLPLLRKMCDEEQPSAIAAAHAFLEKQIERAMALLPEP